MDKLTALRECPLFRVMDESVRVKLAARFEERSFAAGEILFREGETARDLLVVMQGAIDIVKGRRDDGGGKLLSHVAPPASIGEAALYGDRPRSATAIAKEQTKVLCLSRQAFQQFAVDDPYSAQQVFFGASRILFERLDHTSQELTVVYDLGKLLGHSPPLNELTREVVERLRVFVPQAEQVTFYLWNMFSEEFEVASGWPAQKPASALTNQSELIKEFATRRATVATHSADGTFALASSLVSDGRVIGFISLTRKHSAFGNEHRNLLEAVCGMMVGAVLSAWAREEERARQRLMQSKQRVS
jgi:CRP-like cAMP-binding protein